MADAFGYTPAQFYRLSLPQLGAFSRYIESKAVAMKDGKSPEPSGNPGTSIDSLDQLVWAFGDENAKRALAEGRF